MPRNSPPINTAAQFFKQDQILILCNALHIFVTSNSQFLCEATFVPAKSAVSVDTHNSDTTFKGAFAQGVTNRLIHFFRDLEALLRYGI